MNKNNIKNKKHLEKEEEKEKEKETEEDVLAKEKTNACFQDMKREYNDETQRLEKEQILLKKKEEDEFLQLAYESGIPVCFGNKITILDKKTNKIINVDKVDVDRKR